MLHARRRETQLVQPFGRAHLGGAGWGAQQFRRTQQVATDVHQHRGHVRVTCRRLLGEHAVDHRLQRRQRRRQAGNRPRKMGDEKVRGVVGFVGQVAGQHLEPHRAQAVLVGAAVDGIAGNLFGRHVTGRADGESGLRHALRFRIDQPRDAEISEHRCFRITEQHVVGLDVAMHDAARMRCIQCGAQLGQDGQALLHAQADRQAIGQAAVLEVFHADEIALRRFHHVVDGDDVGVPQAGQGMGFVDEALRKFGIARHVSVEQFQRDGPLQRLLGR